MVQESITYNEWHNEKKKTGVDNVFIRTTELGFGLTLVTLIENGLR